MFQLISQDDLEFAQSMEFPSFWFLYNLQAIQKHLVKSRNYQMNHFLVALYSSTSYQVGLPYSNQQIETLRFSPQFTLDLSKRDKITTKVSIKLFIYESGPNHPNHEEMADVLCT